MTGRVTKIHGGNFDTSDIIKLCVGLLGIGIALVFRDSNGLIIFLLLTGSASLLLLKSIKSVSLQFYEDRIIIISKMVRAMYKDIKKVSQQNKKKIFITVDFPNKGLKEIELPLKFASSEEIEKTLRLLKQNTGLPILVK